MPDKISKFIQALNAKTRARLKKKLLAIKLQPFQGQDIKKLKGATEDIYRLRMGKIRIVYRVRDGEVEVVDIDYRGNIY